MNSTDIKLNLIIKELNQIKSVMMILLENSNQDLDLDQIKSIINSSDQDQDDHNDQIDDHDLIEWYKDFLIKNGIDPEDRKYETAIRSIRYFYNKFSEISNPFKYQLRFMPEKIEVYKPEETEDLKLIFGLEASLVEEKFSFLTKEIINKVKEENPRLSNIEIRNILKDPPGMFTRIFTAKAINMGLISKD